MMVLNTTQEGVFSRKLIRYDIRIARIRRSIVKNRSIFRKLRVPIYDKLMKSGLLKQSLIGRNRCVLVRRSSIRELYDLTDGELHRYLKERYFTIARGNV